MGIVFNYIDPVAFNLGPLSVYDGMELSLLSEYYLVTLLHNVH